MTEHGGESGKDERIIRIKELEREINRLKDQNTRLLSMVENLSIQVDRLHGELLTLKEKDTAIKNHS